MAMDQTTASESWTQPGGHPLDDEPTRATPVVSDLDESRRRRRGLGANRHLSSIVIALLAVPAAYGFLDYGFYRATTSSAQTLDDLDLPQKVLIALGVGGGLLLLAALTGRISALGPFVAGLVWGVGPLVWVVMDFSSYVSRLNDIPEIYDNTGFGLYSAGFVLFPAVAGMLIGTAIAGRWRRHRPAPTA